MSSSAPIAIRRDIMAPTPQQVALVLFHRSRGIVNKPKNMQLNELSGLKTLWVNRILKKRWGWDMISKKQLYALGKLEELAAMHRPTPKPAAQRFIDLL